MGYGSPELNVSLGSCVTLSDPLPALLLLRGYLFAYLKNPTAKLQQTFVHVSCGRGSVALWWRAIGYVFPVLWMTSCIDAMNIERQERNSKLN